MGRRWWAVYWPINHEACRLASELERERDEGRVARWCGGCVLGGVLEALNLD